MKFNPILLAPLLASGVLAYPFGPSNQPQPAQNLTQPVKNPAEGNVQGGMQQNVAATAQQQGGKPQVNITETKTDKRQSIMFRVGAKIPADMMSTMNVNARDLKQGNTPSSDTTAGDSTDKDTTADDPTAKDPTAKDSTAKDSTAKDSTAKDSTAEDSTAEDSTAKDSTAKDSTAKDSTAKDSTAKDSTAEDSTAKDSISSNSKYGDVSAEDSKSPSDKRGPAMIAQVAMHMKEYMTTKGWKADQHDWNLTVNGFEGADTGIIGARVATKEGQKMSDQDFQRFSTDFQSYFAECCSVNVKQHTDEDNEEQGDSTYQIPHGQPMKPGEKPVTDPDTQKPGQVPTIDPKQQGEMTVPDSKAQKQGQVPDTTDPKQQGEMPVPDPKVQKPGNVPATDPKKQGEMPVPDPKKQGDMPPTDPKAQEADPKVHKMESDTAASGGENERTQRRAATPKIEGEDGKDATEMESTEQSGADSDSETQGMTQGGANNVAKPGQQQQQQKTETGSTENETKPKNEVPTGQTSKDEMESTTGEEATSGEQEKLGQQQTPQQQTPQQQTPQQQTPQQQTQQQQTSQQQTSQNQKNHHQGKPKEKVDAGAACKQAKDMRMNFITATPEMKQKKEMVAVECAQ